jgi:hypothetical protein
MSFDVDTSTSVGARLETSDLDLPGAFRAQALDADSLRCLRYMHDVESHTVCYLRDLLVTDAHTDPTITTFLTMWNYEEHWHGEALAAVLRAHDEPAGIERAAMIRVRRRPISSLRTAAFMLGSLVVPDMTAIAMTWGAVNEWTTQAGYARLAARADHPVLTELLRRIMRQEGRHIDFYRSEARRRLESSRRTQRLTRLALSRWWNPVGSGVLDDTETSFVVAYLFGGPDGATAVARIDRNVDRLPGLAGLGLVQSARAHTAVA